MKGSHEGRDACQSADPGKTFAGWESHREWFRIVDGAIVGGSLTKRVPRNEFLCATTPMTPG